MAIYKREPITHKLPTDWDDTDAVSYFNINGFSGLSTYDNPLLNEQNSTYDSKNVYVDSTGSLTVRPRLVPADSNTYSSGALKVFIVGSYKFCIFKEDTGALYLKETSINTSQSLKIKDIDAVTVVSDLDAAGNTLVYVIFTSIAGNIKYYRYNSDGTYTVVSGDVLLYSSQTSVDLQYKYYNILNDKVTRGYISSGETYDLTSFEKTADKTIGTDGTVPNITVEYAGDLFCVSILGSKVLRISDGVMKSAESIPESFSSQKVTAYKLVGGSLEVYTRSATSYTMDGDEQVGTTSIIVQRINLSTLEYSWNKATIKIITRKNVPSRCYYCNGTYWFERSVQGFSYVFATQENLSERTEDFTSSVGYTAICTTYAIIAATSRCIICYAPGSTSIRNVYSVSGAILYTMNSNETYVIADDTIFIQDPGKAVTVVTKSTKAYESNFESIVAAGFSSGKAYVVSSVDNDDSGDYTVRFLESGYTFKISNLQRIRGENDIYVSHDLSKVLYWNSSTSKVRYIEQTPVVTETRPTDIIPVLSNVTDDFVTSFMLDGFWWFIFEHHIFATGAGAKGTLTLEYFDPRKYFSVSETITAAIRISDTSFWVLHNDGAYLIYKGSEADDDGFYTWYITNTAKSKGCDFLNGVCTLPATSYVAVVTNQDVCSIQMRENVQTDERILVPMTNALQVYIQDIISNTTSVVSARYKYLALFFMNKKTQDGKTPCLVYDDANSSWWVWEFPVYEVYQVVELESNIVFSAKSSTSIRWFTFSEDLYYNTSGYLQVPAYYDNLSDGSVTQIDWYWESAMLLFNSINYRKQLLETTFTFGEFNQRTADGLEQDASNFTYSFEVYAKRQSAKEGGVSEATVTRAKNSTFRTLISTFTFLQLRLQNVEPESDEEYDLLSVCTKPQISNIIFKYRVLSGGIT